MIHNLFPCAICNSTYLFKLKENLDYLLLSKCQGECFYYFSERKRDEQAGILKKPSQHIYQLMRLLHYNNIEPWHIPLRNSFLE